MLFRNSLPNSQPVSFRRIWVITFLLIALPVAVFLALKQTDFLNRAFGKKANLVIDVGSSYKVEGGVWRNLAQGGEEKGRMLLPVVDQLKSLGPRYIRIDHIYDAYDVVKREASGELAFDWSKLDLTISDILGSGAKPFLSISYMPPALTSGNILETPNNWTEWENLVQKTIEHYSGTLGITNVYYEVWNEPDLFGSFKTSGEKNYLDLYTHSAIGASRAKGVKLFKFGGPATTGFYSNWMRSLLALTARNNLRLDFFSWHRYSKNIDAFEEDLLGARKILVDYPAYQNIELIISEIGPNSENDAVYDNFFGAIHTIAYAAVLEKDLEKAFLFEIKDGPGEKQYWGRWGLFTNEKFGSPQAKPRLRALQFLNKMVGDKVNVAGDGSWVRSFAKQQGNIIRTLVVNYDPSGSHYEAVPISFINLPYTNFIFRRTDFSGKFKETPVTITTNNWSIIEEFNANTAAIFEIIPQ